MDLSDHIFKDIKDKKKTSLILSGGNSPLKHYRKLFKKKINWSNVNFFLLDERLVNIKSKLSNFYNINKIILSKNLNVNLEPLNSKFLKKKKLSKTLLLLKKSNVISILGMGDDGHYASIFSHSKLFKKLINTSSPPGIFITERIGNPKVKRATMNLSMILMSKKIYLILNSKKKLKLFHNAIKEKDYKKYSIYSLIEKTKKKLIIFDGKKFKNIC